MTEMAEITQAKKTDVTLRSWKGGALIFPPLS